jgi:hypothetical protein
MIDSGEIYNLLVAGGATGLGGGGLWAFIYFNGQLRQLYSSVEKLQDMLADVTLRRDGACERHKQETSMKIGELHEKINKVKDEQHGTQLAIHRDLADIKAILGEMRGQRALGQEIAEALRAVTRTYDPARD